MEEGWDHLGIIHFEFLKHNETLNAHLYVRQLQREHKNSVQKYCAFNTKNVVPHDNARLHTARKTQGKNRARFVCSTRANHLHLILHQTIITFF